jgi:hypothetical protein
LLNAEVEVLAVYEELWEVEELRDEFADVGELAAGISETIGDGGEESVWNVEFPALELLSTVCVGAGSYQKLQDNGKVGVVEAEEVRLNKFFFVMLFNIVFNFDELLDPLGAPQTTHTLLQISIFTLIFLCFGRSVVRQNPGEDEILVQVAVCSSA